MKIGANVRKDYYKILMERNTDENFLTKSFLDGLTIEELKDLVDGTYDLMMDGIDANNY